MTPAQYFGLDSKSRYRDLFNEIYKLTQVSRVEAEIEDGEIEVEEEEPSEPVDTPEMEEEPNKARENDFPCRPEDLSCKSVRGETVRQYQARPTQTSLNHFHGLHFSPLSLPPAPLGQLSLAGGYPLPLPLLPPVRPWPHLPPLFMPSLPPPPLSHLSQDAFVPPDEKVRAALLQVLKLILTFAGVEGVPGVRAEGPVLGGPQPAAGELDTPLLGLHGQQGRASLRLSLHVQGAARPLQALQGRGGPGRVQELHHQQGLEEGQCQDDGQLQTVLSLETPSEAVQKVFAQIRDI